MTAASVSLVAAPSAVMTVLPVVAAAMASAVSVMMVLSVMIALHVWLIRKPAGQQGLHRRVRASGYTAVQPDPGLRERHLRASADPAAD